MTKVIMRKQGGALVPDEPEAAESIARIPDGTQVVVEARRPRSMEQLRKWWKMMSILADNMPDVVEDKRIVVDKRAVSDMVLVAVGECDWRFKIETGEMWPQARSIAFESMEAETFDRLWERAKFYILANWLPIGSAQLEAEVEDFFAGPEGRSLGKRVVREREPALP